MQARVDEIRDDDLHLGEIEVSDEPEEGTDTALLLAGHPTLTALRSVADDGRRARRRSGWPTATGEGRGVHGECSKATLPRSDCCKVALLHCTGPSRDDARPVHRHPLPRVRRGVGHHPLHRPAQHVQGGEVHLLHGRGVAGQAHGVGAGLRQRVRARDR